MKEYVFDFSFICVSFFSFNGKDEKEQRSNMVVLEVHTPSGYTVEKDTLTTLLSLKGVKKIETKDGETIVIVYIDHMNSKEELCVDIDAYRVHKVAEQKPAAVRIYDYYDDCKCLIYLAFQFVNLLDLLFIPFFLFFSSKCS